MSFFQRKGICFYYHGNKIMSSTHYFDVEDKNIHITVDGIFTGRVLFYTANSEVTVICICFQKDISKEPLLFVTTDSHPNFSVIKSKLHQANSLQLTSSSFTFIPFN